jgi:hypothetical protein
MLERFLILLERWIAHGHDPQNDKRTSVVSSSFMLRFALAAITKSLNAVSESTYIKKRAGRRGLERTGSVPVSTTKGTEELSVLARNSLSLHDLKW